MKIQISHIQILTIKLKYMKKGNYSCPMTKAVGSKVSTKMPKDPPMIKNKSKMTGGIQGGNFIIKGSSY